MLTKRLSPLCALRYNHGETPMTRRSVTTRCNGILPGIAFCVFSATVGYAQQPVQERPVSFGLGLGAIGRPGWGVGSLAQGTLEFATPLRDLGVRLDGTFAAWSRDFPARRTTSVTGDLVYSRRIGAIAPYVLGGAGGYAEPGLGTSFGLNAGLGIKASVWRIQPFVEAREHFLSADRTRRASALTIGLRF